MRCLARGGLALGLVFLLLYFLGFVLGIIPGPLRDLALVEARVVTDVGPMLASEDRPRGRRPYLRLTVASGQNLIGKSVRSELNIYPMVADCTNTDLTLDAYGPYYRGLHVANLGTDSDDPRFQALGKAHADRYEYLLFIPLVGRLRSESDFNRPMPAYDLRRERRTLCIRVGGGNMMGGHFRSNEIRLQMPGAAE